jgi:hypothetical protein
VITTLALLATAHALEPIELPVRVHLVASSNEQLDSSDTRQRDIERRFRDINRAFAPAGIVWRVESIVVDRPSGADSAYAAASADHGQRRNALNLLRSAPTRLAPGGFDLYVIEKMGPVGIGGAYQCAAGEPPGMGAAFVSARGPRGDLPTRKWAHELGHALGLQHTPCSREMADRMMMSGKCSYAEPGRVGFTAAEIAVMREQAATGHAAPCHRSR